MRPSTPIVDPILKTKIGKSSLFTVAYRVIFGNGFSGLLLVQQLPVPPNSRACIRTYRYTTYSLYIFLKKFLWRFVNWLTSRRIVTNHYLWKKWFAQRCELMQILAYTLIVVCELFATSVIRSCRLLSEWEEFAASRKEEWRSPPPPSDLEFFNIFSCSFLVILSVVS